VEQSCEALARRAQFLQPKGKSNWPDGTIAARYGFIHALYQNVLYYRVTPGRRARLHQRIGQREEGGYRENTVEIATKLAVHFEEGQDYQRALHYLKLAGEKAVRRSANREAIGLFHKGLALLKSMPESAARTQHELLLHIALRVPLIHSRGYAAAEVGHVYGRARELYAQVGETPQLFSVLWGLWLYYVVRAEHAAAYDIGEQLRSLAENKKVSFPLAHYAPGVTLFWLGDLIRTQEYLARSLALYDRSQHGSHIFLYSQDPKTMSLSYQAWGLWFSGYPEQARQCSAEAISWAQEVGHPFSLAFAWGFAAEVPCLRREGKETQQRAEAAIALCVEQGFPFWATWGMVMRGWALAEQGKHEEGITAMREGLVAYEATGAGMGKTLFLSLLADAYGKAGQSEAGLQELAKAFEFLHKTNERAYEAELYRLKGELTLQQASLGRVKNKLRTSQKRSNNSNPQPLTPSTEAEVAREAEECFLKAIDIAHQQQAKSWELRASTNLARLWLQQDKTKQAHTLLSKIYNWFTEGFDTKDLQGAKTLLDDLGEKAKRGNG
ncbi:MAG: hypothetical protein AB7G75_36890, partial [Candidatus Binatia bacterium]